MATVHFTLGEDLGIQLAEIAKEHVLSLDLGKANSLWVDSFGCPEDMAERLTAGELVVVIDDPEKCLVNVTRRDDLPKNRQKEYPELSAKDIFRVIDKYFKTERDFEEEYDFTDFRMEISNVNRLIATNQDLYLDSELTSICYDVFPEWFPKGVKISGTIEIMPRTIFKSVIESKGESNSFTDFLEDASMTRISRYGDAYKMLKIIWVSKKMIEALKAKDKILALEDFAIKHYGVDNHHKYATERHLKDIEEIFRDWTQVVNDEFSHIAVVDDEKKLHDPIDAYIKGVENIDKAAKNFGPVNITDGYDAGWLAPDGSYFGMNGTTANLLHVNLADMIAEYYKMEKPDSFGFALDAFLAKQGFVKIHHNEVLYEGYDCVMTDKPVPLTYAQKKAIKEYGNACYDGKLRFGYDKKPMEVDVFMLLDESELEDLLGY